MDADALFAGAASVTGASHVILQLGELGIIEIGVAEQARDEAERNLRSKLPAALPAFRALTDACTTTLTMSPKSTASRLAPPILAAAIAAECRWLITFNIRDYRTDRLHVSAPGPFLEALRALLAAGAAAP